MIEVIAQGDSLALALAAPAWTAGEATLRVKEIHGAEIRFELPPGSEADAGSTAPAAPGDSAAARWSGTLALPPDVEIVSVTPEAITVTVTGTATGARRAGRS